MFCVFCLSPAVHAISSQVHLLSCPFPADGFLHDVSLNVTPELRVSEVEIWQPLDTGTYRILSEEDLVMQKNGHLSYSVKVEREIERGHILALRGSAYGSNFPATIRYSKFLTSRARKQPQVIYPQSCRERF